MLESVAVPTPTLVMPPAPEILPERVSAVLPEPKALAKFGERWAPHRTTAAWYLWRAADFLKKGEKW